MDGTSGGSGNLQEQIDELIDRLEAQRSHIDALGRRADASEFRADAADVRADAADDRADAAEARVDDLAAQLRVDRDMIAELQQEGVLGREHAEQMEQALKSSRVIGAAIGMLMASRNVREDEAFDILRAASANSNRKLRDIAQELVTSHR
jgi:hypothetical protein